MIANVHSIETFSGVDGPGLRYVLFLQGCNRQCLFCHNADTIPIHGGKQMTLEAILDDFRQYQHFYRNKGGITVSGGEPLLQAEFIVELFRILKKEGFHTCIETQGSLFTPNPLMQELVELTDLFIVDLKGSCNEQAMEISNGTIDRTLAFLSYLNSNGKTFQVTYVLLPTLNDREQDAQQLANILSNYQDDLMTFRVLPYHKLGIQKWNDIGIKYRLDSIQEPTPHEVHTFLSKIRTYLHKR